MTDPTELIERVLEVVADAYQEGYNDGHADTAHEEGLDADSMHEGTAQAKADLRQRVVTALTAPSQEPTCAECNGTGVAERIGGYDRLCDACRGEGVPPAQLLKRADKDFMTGEDGFVVFWPDTTKGALDARTLRLIADELDRRNEAWAKVIAAAMLAERANGGPDA